tara:strand:+ start:479 stop:652 length:174 start_codon:yes stop_codon:yes gene_type:complete
MGKVDLPFLCNFYEVEAEHPMVASSAACGMFYPALLGVEILLRFEQDDTTTRLESEV